jgi:hypothetical protein
MLKLELSVVIISAFVVMQPSYGQAYDYDYSGMVPFGTTASSGYLGERTIQSIYRNPLNRDTSGVRNGLPPVTTDSFVYEAGGMAELIYGDEGVGSIPPYFNFTSEHRIDAGLVGTRAEGLTTGHSSPLPTTWGGDDFYLPEPLRSAGSGAPVTPPRIPEYVPVTEGPSVP